MQVAVDVLLPDGRCVTLGHGGIIGRLRTATVRIPDPRVSEAHAMVSLRGHTVQLLGLRGRFYVDGETRTRVDLQAGMEVHLARDISLRVLDVRIPDTVLALSAPGMPQQTLLGLTSVFASPPRLQNGWSADADAVLWPSDEGWLRGEGEVLEAGPLQVGDTTFEVREVATQGVADTELGTGFQAPLVLECFYDVVHLRRSGRVEASVSGAGARLISELVSIQQPVAWDDLAKRIWGDDLPPHSLRKRWDMQLYRLRNQLRSHQIRTDLVRSHGTGLVELVLGERDQAVDHT